jgi:L-tartrate/succinate antiporter
MARTRRLALALRALVPLLLAAGLALAPAPPRLDGRAWRYFALFAGVIAGLITEPLPAAAVGLLGVTVAAAAGFFGADPADATRWLLGGFADPTVWLIFGAFVFSLGFERTGLGRRLALLLVRRLGGTTLGLGYAIFLGDLLLAPFIPSNAARSGGIVLSVVRAIPPLYGSAPGPSARRIGAYLVATSFAASAVTSSLFLTGLAPNLLAVTLVEKTTGIALGWTEWLAGAWPAGLVLVALTPWLLHRFYPPEIRRSPDVAAWAARELEALGPPSGREARMAALGVLALGLWVLGGRWVTATEVVIGVVVAMVVLGVVSWQEVVGHGAAWNMLVWFATLVTLAGGLAKLGFVGWLASGAARGVAALPAAAAVGALLAIFFVLHYLFASVTAHATALLPIFLGVGAAVPGFPPRAFALLLCYALGLMGILTPYASGPAPLYYETGFVPPRRFWLLGAGLGLLFLAVLLGVTAPYLARNLK